MRGSARSSEHDLIIQGRDVQELVRDAILAVRSLIHEPVRSDARSRPESVVPFQAEGPSLAELVQRLLDDVLTAIIDSPTEMVDVELANVLETDKGLRAWGYLWFGSRSRDSTPFSIAVDPIPRATAAGDTEIRLIVTPAPPFKPGAPASGGNKDVAL